MTRIDNARTLAVLVTMKLMPASQRGGVDGKTAEPSQTGRKDRANAKNGMAAIPFAGERRFR